MGCPAKQEATRVCWRERETGARSKGSGRPLSERTLVRPVCHRRLSQPKGSDLHSVESRPLRLRTLVRVQLSPPHEKLEESGFSFFLLSPGGTHFPYTKFGVGKVTVHLISQTFDVNEIAGRCKQGAGKREKPPHFIATAVNSPGRVLSSHAGCSSKRFRVNPLLMMAFIISLIVYLLYRHLGNCSRMSLS